MRWATIKKHVGTALTFGRPVPHAAARDAERVALLLRMQAGRVRFDDIKRLHALEDLDGNWGCTPLRVLLYKLRRDDD